MWVGLLGLLLQAPTAPPSAVTDLAGTWRFRTGDTAAFAQPALDDSGWETIAVPGAWTRQGHPGYRGFAWYRTRFVIDQLPSGALGLRFRSVATAFEVYVDGERVGGVGGFPPRYRARPVVPIVLALPAASLTVGEHVIAVRVYSAESTGGIVGEVRFGEVADLLWQGRRLDFYLLATALLLVGIGMYQIFFWMRRPQAYEHLFIFLYCAGLALFFVSWMPSVRLALAPWVYWYRLYLALAAASTAAFCFAFRRIFDLESNRLVTALCLYFLGLVPPALILPGWGQLRVLAKYFVDPGLLVATATILVLAIMQLRRGAPHARTLVWGIMLLAIALFHDILIDWGVLAYRPQFPWMILVGSIAFVSSLAMTTAGKFVDTETAALYDRLTGLYRREVVMDALAREIRRSARTRLPLAVIMLDVDRFKAINDTHGHPAGDRALTEVGRRLAEAGRAVDWLGRYGGEEFIGVLASTNGAGGVHAAERLRQAVAALPISIGRTTRSITLSAGVAAYDGGNDWPTAEELVGAADAALYRAKDAGRNCVRE